MTTSSAAASVDPATLRVREPARARTRLAGLDLLRVVGLLAVVAGHTWPANGTVREVIFSCHVSVFFFLSGFFWARGRPVARDLAARARTLLVPYLACLLLIGGALALLAPETASRTTAIQDLAGGVHMVGRPLEAFWFVTALFVATACYRLLDRVPIPVKWVIAVALAAAGTIAGPELAEIPLSLANGVTALIFLVGGETLARYQARIPRRLVLAVVALAVATIAIATGASRPLDMKAGQLGTPVVSVAVALLLCGALTTLALALPLTGRLGAATTALARVAIGVVLVHPLVLWVLDAHGIDGMKAFLVTVAVAWGLALIAERTPLAPVLLGVPRRRVDPARLSGVLAPAGGQVPAP